MFCVVMQFGLSFMIGILLIVTGLLVTCSACVYLTLVVISLCFLLITRGMSVQLVA